MSASSEIEATSSTVCNAREDEKHLRWSENTQMLVTVSAFRRCFPTVCLIHQSPQKFCHRSGQHGPLCNKRYPQRDDAGHGDVPRHEYGPHGRQPKSKCHAPQPPLHADVNANVVPSNTACGPLVQGMECVLTWPVSLFLRNLSRESIARYIEETKLFCILRQVIGLVFLIQPLVSKRLEPLVTSSSTLY